METNETATICGSSTLKVINEHECVTKETVFNDMNASDNRNECTWNPCITSMFF